MSMSNSSNGSPSHVAVVNSKVIPVTVGIASSIGTSDRVVVVDFIVLLFCCFMFRLLLVEGLGWSGSLLGGG